MTTLMPRTDTPKVIDGEVVDTATAFPIGLWASALIAAGTAVASAVAIVNDRPYPQVPIGLFLLAMLLFGFTAGRHGERP